MASESLERDRAERASDSYRSGTELACLAVIADPPGVLRCHEEAAVLHVTRALEGFVLSLWAERYGETAKSLRSGSPMSSQKH